MNKLPSGISDFRYLKTDQYIYIDKSMYIEKLENYKRYIHFLRPRRFGKSLFTSMLFYYYDLASEDKFDLLFKDTYIHEHPTKEKNSYYVLTFNFSGLTGKQGIALEEEFNEKVYKTIKEFKNRYGFHAEIPKHLSAASMLNGLLSDIQIQLNGHDIYVIIDEYDHFANDLLSFRFDEFKSIMGSDGYVRAFYEELKNGTQKGIGRIFVTGVSPISLDSMTSGIGAAHPWCNISTNLSLDSGFHEMMEFTSEEVQGLISTVDDITDQENVLLEMKQYYDGYHFAEDAKHHLFNPNMVLYYLDSYQRFGKAPRDIVDPNIYSDYSKLEQLLKITENLDVKDSEKEDHRVNVKRILDGEHPNVVITTQFTLLKSFNDQDFFSLLFYLGYLTIDHVEEFELTMKIPNMVMKKVFINYFQSMLEKELDFQADIKGWQSAIASFITKNDATLYIQEIEHTLHRYSDRVLIDFKEKNVQQIGEMIVSGVTGVDSDLEDENDDGYSDHVIIPINSKHHRKLIEYTHLCAQGEYLKVNYTQAQLQKAIKEAEEQIVKYKAARQIQRYEYDSWIMIFSKDKCVYSQRK